MVNWITGSLKDDPDTELDDVDHEIQILGLKRPVLPFMAQSALASFMFLSPLLFWLGPLVLWYGSWRFWKADLSGHPIEYQPWFKKRLGCRLVYEVFKVLPRLRHGDSAYR